MLQSFEALSVYTKSIRLLHKIAFTGTCRSDFYNRFYVILPKIQINHCIGCRERQVLRTGSNGQFSWWTGLMVNRSHGDQVRHKTTISCSTWPEIQAKVPQKPAGATQNGKFMSHLHTSVHVPSAHKKGKRPGITALLFLRQMMCVSHIRDMLDQITL